MSDQKLNNFIQNSKLKNKAKPKKSKKSLFFDDKAAASESEVRK